MHQLLYQFPSLFEFNENFLVSIAFHSYSLLYGTFIGNCEKDKKKLDITRQTISLWTELNSHKELYKNVLYDTRCSLVDPNEFYVETTAVRIRLWEEFYLRWSIPRPNKGSINILHQLNEQHQKNEAQIMEMMEKLEKYKKALKNHNIKLL